MRIGKLPDQVIRLAVLFVCAAIVMVVVRQVLIPPSFGKYGHYRADAIDVAAAQDIKYAGWSACVECHDEIEQAKSKSYHRSLSCEVCHGAAADHVKDPEGHAPVVPRKRGEACLYCHSYLASRPTGFPQIIERLHNPLEPCISCHNPHDPTPPETPAGCGACHGQIARTLAVSYHALLDCEKCHQVPPEHKLNPRAHPAQEPADRSVCGRCHAAGAAGDPSLPRVDMGTHGGRYLCWQCHYPHFPEVGSDEPAD